MEGERPLPIDIQFGNISLKIPDDITPQECAKLSVVLSFAASGVLVGYDQNQVNQWLENMGVARLFVES